MASPVVFAAESVLPGLVQEGPPNIVKEWLESFSFTGKNIGLKELAIMLATLKGDQLDIDWYKEE